MKALFRPATTDLVHAALETLNTNSSPGHDGVPTSICTKFAGFVVPHMNSIFLERLKQDLFPHWSLGLDKTVACKEGEYNTKKTGK